MKKAFSLLIGLLCLPLLANMAAPYREGSLSGSPFISRSVAIEHEYLNIRPDSSKMEAEIIAEYHIRVDSAGQQIPFLFYAMEYEASFQVWLDDQVVVLDSMPRLYEGRLDTLFTDFDFLYDHDRTTTWREIPAGEDVDSGYELASEDLHFFTADLDTGRHIIRVTYTAQAWVDLQDWVKVYSYRYALAPAAYWQSFGGLTLTIDARNLVGAIRGDAALGLPDSGNLATVATWEFDELPTEVLILSHQPPLTGRAQMLRMLSPRGITLGLGIPLALLHLIWLLRYRRRHPRPKRNWVRLIGLWIIPFLMLLIFNLSFGWIDDAIGPDASRYHGYTIFSFVLYPILVAVYALATWGLERGLLYLREKRQAA